MTTAGFYGTLAATRALGRRGIPVAIADSESLSVTTASRYVASRHVCPNLRDDRFVDWLVEFGKRSRKRHVLLPSCDDSAWLFARHKDLLAEYFHLVPSPMEATYTLLNKRRLADACTAVGLPVPAARAVTSESDILQIALHASFPLLIKPVTQALFMSREKGEVVEHRSQFPERYRAFARHEYARSVRAHDPDVRWPLVQEFMPDAAEGIYTLTGYLDPRTGIRAVRASTKVLQARKLGVGVCFEEAAVDDELVEGVCRLFEHIRYAGIFELEFIRAGDRFLLIDANPRFYGEMEFEIARGMPLPLFAYHQALGDEAALRVLAKEAALPQPSSPRAHTHRVSFELLLWTQRMSGALSARQASVWREWVTRSGTNVSDSTMDQRDWKPLVVDTARIVYGQVRYPLEFLRMLVKHRLGGVHPDARIAPDREFVAKSRTGS
jgi:predicted ATP-grasp superfamily ATP-dependent carboligase